MKISNLYTVYILSCADDTYYTGITNNVNRRLIEHNESKNITSYTFSRRPVDLVFEAKYTNVEVAIAFEKKIKKWSKAKKEALINGEFNELPKLAKKKFMNRE